MQYKTFPRGILPNECKHLSVGREVIPVNPPEEMVFFLDQHIGKPAKAVVKKGQSVQVGTVLAEADGFVSANVISSCSGTVKAIDSRMSAEGVIRPCIVVTNDGAFTAEEAAPCDPAKLTREQILERVKAAGIVGLGGAGFPTHVKLSPKNPEAIDYVIANGCECEPYITCDDTLMQQHADKIISGLKIVLQLFPNAKGVVAIETNKPEAIAAMKKAAEGQEKISIQVVRTKYPQGCEKHLIYAVTGRKLGGGKLPADLGCMVDNVATLAAIHDAVCEGKPLTERLFTVSGDAVANPGNFLVKIGTPIAALLDAAGGFAKEPKKVILGGPMMGSAITELAAPVCKSNNALTCFSIDPVEAAQKQMTNCIRCGKCISVCPIGLVPQRMAVAAQRKDLAEFEKIYGMECIGCGSCSYICPAKRPLVQLFKQSKAAILAQRAKEAKK